MDVRTLVPPALWERTGEAVSRAAALWNASLTVPSAGAPTLFHANDIPSLYAVYPYDRLTALIVDVDTFSRVRAQTGSGIRSMPLSQLAASWDCCMIVYTRSHARRIRRILHTPFGSRCTVIERSEDCSWGTSAVGMASALFGRWMHTSLLPPAHSAADPSLRDALAKLKPIQRAVLNQVCRNPTGWTVKAMAAASGGERRTLERAYAEHGLPSPAKMLRLAEAAARPAGD